MNKKTSKKTGAIPDSSEKGIYLNRELSQLAFNRRVLAQAEDRAVPLLERLRFLCIVSSNMDEFFEVRIASLLAQDPGNGPRLPTPGLAEMLERIGEECHALIHRQYALLHEEILPQLAASGIRLLRHE